MLLDVNERMRKVGITPTIQCKVDAQIFQSFSTLVGYSKCSYAVLPEALIKDSFTRNKDVWNEQ